MNEVEEEAFNMMFELIETANRFNDFKDLTQEQIVFKDYLTRLFHLSVINPNLKPKKIENVSTIESGYYYTTDKNAEFNEIYIENGIIKFVRSYDKIKSDEVRVFDIYCNEKIKTTIVYQLNSYYIENNELFPKVIICDIDQFYPSRIIDTLYDPNLIQPEHDYINKSGIEDDYEELEDDEDDYFETIEEIFEPELEYYVTQIYATQKKEYNIKKVTAYLEQNTHQKISLTLQKKQKTKNYTLTPNEKEPSFIIKVKELDNLLKQPKETQKVLETILKEL